MIVTAVPQQPFKLSQRHENSFHFDSDKIGAEGLFILSREMPTDRELNVHIYLRHTRKNVRDVGKVMQELESGIGGDAFGIVTDLVRTSTVPWLIIAKKAIPMAGRILAKISDRDFGFLSAFENFGAEFEGTYEIDREKDFSEDASLVYSWSIDE